jgi:amino acid transporter
MLPSLQGIADFKLTDLLSSAGSTIGIIIASTLFLQFLSAKYGEVGGRYRALTSEYRGRQPVESRHGLLQPQIRTHRRRLRLIIWASWLAAVALLCFILSILAGGFSMAFPDTRAFLWSGTTTLLLGLVLIAIAVFLELVESVQAPQELAEEAGDLDDDVKRQTN